MEKLSGLLLDSYDDLRGEVLRSLFPTPAEVPEQVKTAHYLSQEERQRLPDDVFALVLRDGDVTLRKYACTDAGNTHLAVNYFLKNAHKLPQVAQKTAAQNLLIACGWYDLEPPEALSKVANEAEDSAAVLADYEKLVQKHPELKKLKHHTPAPPKLSNMGCGPEKTAMGALLGGVAKGIGNFMTGGKGLSVAGGMNALGRAGTALGVAGAVNEARSGLSNVKAMEAAKGGFGVL